MWYRIYNDNRIFSAQEMVEQKLSSTSQVKVVGKDSQWRYYGDVEFQRLLQSDIGFTVGADGVIHKAKTGSIISYDDEITDMHDQYDIGWKYYKHDDKEALKWFLKCAYQNYAPGQNMVGCFYHDAICVGRDYDEAFKWYSESAKQENLCGIMNLAMCYYYGQGCSVNYAKALALYLKIPDNILSISTIKNIASIYEDGKAGNPQIEMALQWYRKAAGRGDVEASENVSRMEMLYNILHQDISKGEKYYLIGRTYDKWGNEKLCNYWIEKSKGENYRKARNFLKKRKADEVYKDLSWKEFLVLVLCVIGLIPIECFFLLVLDGTELEICCILCVFLDVFLLWGFYMNIRVIYRHNLSV